MQDYNYLEKTSDDKKINKINSILIGAKLVNYTKEIVKLSQKCFSHLLTFWWHNYSLPNWFKKEMRMIEDKI